jgi:hypothetical protein
VPSGIPKPGPCTASITSQASPRANRWPRLRRSPRRHPSSPRESPGNRRGRSSRNATTGISVRWSNAGARSPESPSASVDPQSTAAWDKGAQGEERLARRLLETVGERAIFLNDLKVPRSRANIDLIAICPSGIWIIDAKNYKGLVEHRDVGRWFRRDVRLYVGGRDRSKLADGLSWQVEAVRNAVGDSDVPIHSALCFTNSDWRLFARPFQHNGVWIVWARKLCEMLVASGPLGSQEAAQIVNRLIDALGSQKGGANRTPKRGGPA